MADHPAEVVLLGFIEHAAHKIHAHGGVVGVLVSKAVQGRSDTEDKSPSAVRDGMSSSVKQVDKDGPAVELFDGNLGTGRKANVGRGELRGIGEG